MALDGPGLIKPFDPSFVVLAMEASVEAIFLSTFVLISQNRMLGAAARQSDLDLQINLLAEHELTRLVRLVDAMAAKMEVDVVDREELGQIEKDVWKFVHKDLGPSPCRAQRR